MAEIAEGGSRARPFEVRVAQPVLDAIDARLALSRVGYAPADDANWKYGVDAAYLTRLLDYWRRNFDWRAAERRLNRFPQYIATIDGQDVHFYHVRAEAPCRLPLVLTHGWPGSVVEFLDVIEPLRAQGFDLVIPSLPGYGFSPRPAAPIFPRRIAALWRKLMIDTLGYKRFGAQGGDWGSSVSIWLGRDHPDVVAAIHLNLIHGPPRAQYQTDAEKDWRQKVRAVNASEAGYLKEQATKPQTIGLALADSPIGFAGWIAEKFHSWGDTHGEIETRFDMDKLLTNIMIYLTTDSVQSAIWLYRAAIDEPLPGRRVEVPTGCALFPAEFSPPPPREVAERAYNVVRWTEMPAGGHFAAMEEPAAFAAEIGAFFRGVANGAIA